MAVIYSGQLNTPVNKTAYTVGATTALAAWSATAVAKPVLTDYSISVAAAGTLQIKFGRADSSSVVFQHLLAGSGTITRRLETPFFGDRDGGIYYVETGMNGLVLTNLSGFEM